MREYDHDFTEFPIYSYILFTPENGRGEKVRMVHEGPYQIINRLGDIYTLEDLIMGKPFDTHITSLRPFYFDSNNISPKEVAIQNAQQHHIERIVNHDGDTNYRKKMWFEVKWLGKPNSLNTWEPYSNLRDTDQLLDYCRLHNFKKLIPSKHK